MRKPARGSQPVAVFYAEDNPESLLDGINRLDAMAMAGLEVVKNGELNRDLIDIHRVAGSVDAYAYVLSANIHRRHLIAEQKRDLIAKLLKAKQSNLQMAKQAKADDKMVAKVRPAKPKALRGLKPNPTITKTGKEKKPWLLSQKSNPPKSCPIRLPIRRANSCRQKSKKSSMRRRKNFAQCAATFLASKARARSASSRSELARCPERTNFSARTAPSCQSCQLWTSRLAWKSNSSQSRPTWSSTWAQSASP